MCVWNEFIVLNHMDRVKRIWYLSPMRAAKVQASLRICAVAPEPPLLAHTSSESRGTFRQKARSLAPLNGWACAVKICHDGMLEDTKSLDGAHMTEHKTWCCKYMYPYNNITWWKRSHCDELHVLGALFQNSLVFECCKFEPSLAHIIMIIWIAM